MKGSKRSEPKSMVKKTPASMKLTSTPEAPCRSYLARMASSANTWQATHVGGSVVRCAVRKLGSGIREWNSRVSERASGASGGEHLVGLRR
jgi:hypothetical protein